MAAAIVVAAGLTAWFYGARAERNHLQTRYGPYADEILRLRDLRGDDPCNLDATSKLVDLLLESGNGVEAQATAEALVDRCPESTEALTKLFAVCMRRQDVTGAVQAADRIIRREPSRPEGYAFRGLAWERKGDLEAAAADFREALARAPRLLDVPVNLSNVLERMGRYCEAAHPLERALEFYPGLDNRFEIRRRIERLRRKGGCPDAVAVGGRTTVPYDHTKEVIVVKGEVNGTEPARFIVDTGASSVVITRKLAVRAGVTPTIKESAIFVQTAGGVIEALPGRLEEVRVGGVTVRDLPVLVCETMGEDVDGLLGISFLSRFNVSIDHQRGEITFEPKSPPDRGDHAKQDVPRAPSGKAVDAPAGSVNPPPVKLVPLGVE